MNVTRKWVAHFFLGLSGMALVVYVLYLGSQHSSVIGSAEVVLMFFVVVSLFIASFLNFYMAYGFRLGWVDEVLGVNGSATLLKNGEVFRANVRIRLVRHLDGDDLSIADEQRIVFFIGNGLPWSCSLKNFRYRSAPSDNPVH